MTGYNTFFIVNNEVMDTSHRDIAAGNHSCDIFQSSIIFSRVSAIVVAVGTKSCIKSKGVSNFFPNWNMSILEFFILLLRKFLNNLLS